MRIRRRRWTKHEDAMVKECALRNAHLGLTGDDGEYRSRLRILADSLGRTYGAVRIRASRIRAVSYEARAQRDIEDAT